MLEESEDGPVFAGGDFDWAALERRRAVSEASCSLGLIGQRLVVAAACTNTEQTVRHRTDDAICPHTNWPCGALGQIVR